MNKSQISLLIERLEQSRDGAKYVIDRVQKGLDSSPYMYCLGRIDTYKEVISMLNRLLLQEDDEMTEAKISQISLLIERFKQSRDGAKYVLDEVQKGVDSSSELYCLGCIDAYNDVISVLNRLYQQEEENDSN